MNQGLGYELAAVMPAAYSTGLFASLCTISVPVETQGATGNPVGTYTPLLEAVDVPCMDAPPSPARINATEIRDVAELMAKGMRHVLLNRCLVDAETWAGKGYLATVDGVVYELLGAENDSQTTQTRLDLQIATVAS